MKIYITLILALFVTGCSLSSNEGSLKQKIITSLNLVEADISVSKKLDNGLYRVVINNHLFLSDGELLMDGRVISLTENTDLIAVAKAHHNTSKSLSQSLNAGTSNIQIEHALPTPSQRYQLVKNDKASNNTLNADIRNKVNDYQNNAIGELLPNKKPNKEAILRRLSRQLTLQLPDENTIVYPAQGEPKDTITVISDPSCGWCNKLHKDIKGLNDAGYTVRYILFPRPVRINNEFVPNPTISTNIQAAYCSQHPKESIDTLFKKKGNYTASHDMSTCDVSKLNVVDAFNVAKYAFAAQNGTPVVMSKNGFISSLDNNQAGYFDLPTLITGLEKKASAHIADLN